MKKSNVDGTQINRISTEPGYFYFIKLNMPEKVVFV